MIISSVSHSYILSFKAQLSESFLCILELHFTELLFAAEDVEKFVL